MSEETIAEQSNDDSALADQTVSEETITEQSSDNVALVDQTVGEGSVAEQTVDDNAMAEKKTNFGLANYGERLVKSTIQMLWPKE